MFHRAYRAWGKRTVDLIVAGAALVLLAPLLLLCAALIKLESRGPVLFLQPRLGRRGAVFTAWKFRTMTDVPRTPTQEIIGRVEGVTRVGAWLRRLKIDELPQLVNVLRGEMSLIGPRPALPQQLDEYTPRAARRLEVRPGLTGLAQVHGNIHLTWPQRWEWDVAYVERLSPALDAWIALRTLLVVAAGERRFLKLPPADPAA